ncbi:Schizosaccharomyces specific protein [Schizosaccharomyces pombe]|uniref:Uncharacterized proline-rich protein C70.10 n=1 Tax=Schizosaccharomyces pombe (strain 972 / ATCC 24843) TaxID=284812 RepID=YJ4A_SCHPO|nr:uncharacterized protein SPCC70.10 [Schizosaccharomyces pombe]P78797.2 RecName: Full=Uncharacterized proline-rich protein C70.10; Flags: Precursor [Schizosaccharomyces pombe 972h-]CAA19360.1 sequence orphan [Schizosaccharomyces pombe]|eukprot:NP_588545.1 uncharacterized protein SPCC70.10 [Schizosaccharomyces pombe]
MFFIVAAGFVIAALIAAIGMAINRFFVRRRQARAGQTKPATTRPMAEARARPGATAVPRRSPTSPQSAYVPATVYTSPIGSPRRGSVRYTHVMAHPNTTTTVSENLPEEVPPPYSPAATASNTPQNEASPAATEAVNHERPASPPPVYRPPEEMV